jgi:Hemerythrin HHE cation binding domain
VLIAVDTLLGSLETVEDLIAGEHAIVREHLGHMRVIAEAAHTEIPLTLRDRLDAVFSFLHTDALPHMQLEEETVYAAVDRILDGPHSMLAMLIDHEVIRRLIGELDHLVGPHGWKRWHAELQPRRLVLEAVIRFHVEKEERLYGPFLNRIEPTAAASVRARLLESTLSNTGTLAGVLRASEALTRFASCVRRRHGVWKCSCQIAWATPQVRPPHVPSWWCGKSFKTPSVDQLHGTGGDGRSCCRVSHPAIGRVPPRLDACWVSRTRCELVSSTLMVY